MRRHLLAAALLAAALLPGCRENGSGSASETPAKEDRPGMFDQVKQQGREKAEATAAYLKEQKEKALAKIQEEIQGSKQEMQALKERAGEAGAQAREKLTQVQARWNQEMESAQAKLASAKATAAENWEKARQDLSEAVTRLKKTYQEAADLLSEGPAANTKDAPGDPG